MKPLYSRFCRTLATFVLIISLNTSVKAQPAAVGDIVFTGYQAQVTDQFAFVPLVAIPNGGVIKFTDHGWNSSTLTFNTGFPESNITYTNTTGVNIPAGREIRITISGAAFFTNGASAGTVSVIGTTGLASNGDQIIAYKGTDPDNLPSVFLSGIHMNVETIAASCGPTTAAGWDVYASCTPNNNHSNKPASLTTDVTAIWMGSVLASGTNDGGATTSQEWDDASFRGCGLPLSTPANVRASVNNYLANNGQWLLHNSATAQPPPFGIMSGCAYLGLAPLPVTLLSFTGKLNTDKTVTVLWKVAQQEDIREYIVEKSLNGNVFWQLGNVAASNGSANFSFDDRQVSTGKNYYRLKIVEISGKTYYSEIKVVTLKAGVTTISYPNPVSDKLTIQQFGTIQNKTAVLYDGQGKMVQQIKLTSQQQTVNMETYPAGVYILKMEDGTVFKVVKQ